MTDGTELHPREEVIQDRIANRRNTEGDAVLPARAINADVDNPHAGDHAEKPIVARDGNLIGPFEQGSEKRSRGRAQLLQVILPIKVWTHRRGGVTIRQHDKFYFEDEDIHIAVHEATIDRHGEIYLTLQDTGVCYPKQLWEFRATDIARYIEEERLRHETEINERAEEARDTFRGDDSGTV